MPVTMRSPSGLNATLRTSSRVPLEGEDLLARRRVPHLRRPVLAAGDDALAVGAERHARTRTSVCPLRVRTSWPVAASHTFTVSSPLPVTMRLPSGLNATLEHPAGVPLEGEEFLARRRRPTPSPSCPRCR